MFRRQKAPKAEQEEKTPYTLYNPHSLDQSKRVWNSDYYQVISVDPAYRNFGLRIERRHTDGRIIPLVFLRANLAINITKDSPELLSTAIRSASDLLDELSHFFQDCHLVIIERQLHENYKSLRVSQHVLTYFLIKMKDMPLLPTILEINSKLKTQELGAPKGLNKNQIKEWSVLKARQLLEWRDDKDSLKIMNQGKRKQDDLADCVCMIEALFSLWGLPITQEPSPIPIIDKKLVLNVKSEPL